MGRRKGLPGLWRHRQELRFRRDPPIAGRARMEPGNATVLVTDNRVDIWIQSAIGDAIFQITGKRFRDLPYGGHDLSWT